MRLRDWEQMNAELENIGEMDWESGGQADRKLAWVVTKIKLDCTNSELVHVCKALVGTVVTRFFTGERYFTQTDLIPMEKSTWQELYAAVHKQLAAVNALGVTESLRARTRIPDSVPTVHVFIFGSDQGQIVWRSQRSSNSTAPIQGCAPLAKELSQERGRKMAEPKKWIWIWK